MIPLMQADPDASSVVDRVLQVLSRVARARKPIAARQIAAEVDLPLSTVYRLLTSLKKWGLLQEHAETRLYEPGPTGVQLAWGFDQNSVLISQSRDEIADLVHRTGESVGLLVAVADQVVCLAMQESEQPLRCSFTRGRAHPLVKGASAKALLAFLPAEHVSAVLQKHYKASPTALVVAMAELEAIRESRHAVTEGEVDVGVWGVSAPIVTDNGRLQGTLSLMAPALRIPGREKELIDLTRAAADRIGFRL